MIKYVIKTWLKILAYAFVVFGVLFAGAYGITSVTDTYTLKQAFGYMSTSTLLVFMLMMMTWWMIEDYKMKKDK